VMFWISSMEKFPRFTSEARVAKGARAKIMATKKILCFIVFRILEKRCLYKLLRKIAVSNLPKEKPEVPVGTPGG